MLRPKKDLQAIHTHDLDELLENLGLLESFKNGEIKCHFCGDVLSERNFGAIFPKGDNIYCVCSKLECLTQIEQE